MAEGKAAPPRVQAFCPGHASGFFSPKTGRGTAEARGSTGAGLCLALGALAEASLVPDDDATGDAGAAGEAGATGDADVAGSPGDAGDRGAAAVEVSCVDAPGGPPNELPVTEAALGHLLADDRDGRARGKRLVVRVQLQLPVGQGLGMSGAGALAATLAAARTLDLGRLEAVRAAHRAELDHLTGLGDVAAQSHGGLVVRTAPGIPPYGAMTSIPCDLDVVVAVLGDPVDKPSILRDAERMQRVVALGDQALAHLREHPSVETFFQVSRAFAEQAGFVSDAMADVLGALDAHGRATAALIGNAVVAAGDADAMVKVLADRAGVEVHRTTVSGSGARRLTG